MDIENNIKINVEVGGAKKNFKDLTATIQEQKDITIEFEKELRRLETQLANTSKGSLAAQTSIKGQIVNIKDALKDQRLSLKDLNNEQEKAKLVNDSYSAGISKTTGVVSYLNQATGGLASKLIDVSKAAKLSGKAMKAALISSGIGALVALVALLYENWDDIKKLISSSNSGLDEQIEKSQALLKVHQDSLLKIESTEESLKRQGKTEKQINEIKKERLGTIIKTAIEELNLEKQRLAELQNLKKEGGSTLEQFARTWGKVFLSIYTLVDDLFSKIGIDLGLGKKIAKGQEWLFEGLFGTEENITESKAKIEEVQKLADAAQNRLDGILNKEDENKKSTTKDTKKVDNTAENLQKIEDLENAYLDSKLDKIQQEKNAVLDKYFTEIELAKQFGLDTTILEEARQNELLEIDKFYKEEKEKAIQEIEDNYLLGKLEKEIAEIERKAEADIIELEALGAKKELIEAVEQESSDRINAIVKEASDETIKNEKEAADAKKKLDNEVLNAKLNMLGKMADGLSTLSEIAGKETAAGKGLAVAAATIDTIRGGVSAFTGMVDVIPGPVGLALGAVAAAGVVASGFASVKKILAVKVPGGGGGGSAPSGGGSAPSGGGGFTPNFNVVGASSQNQLAETVAGSTSEPTRAYVVYDDVKKAGDIESNAIAAAGI